MGKIVGIIPQPDNKEQAEKPAPKPVKKSKKEEK